MPVSQLQCLFLVLIVAPYLRRSFIHSEVVIATQRFLDDAEKELTLEKELAGGSSVGLGEYPTYDKAE